MFLNLVSIQKTKIGSPLSLVVFIALFFSTVPSYSLFEYVTIETFDGLSISGEKITESEGRWFWEIDQGSVYVNLFEINKDQPRIELVKKDTIKTMNSIWQNYSLYKDYLMKKKITLQTTPLIGWNYVSTGHDGHHLHENLYGNFAWDIEKQKSESSFQNEGSMNSDYYSWGKSVRSPIQGTVIDFQSDIEDNEPDRSLLSDLKHKGDGNFILLHVDGPFYFVLLHLKKNSLSQDIYKGAKIQVGQHLGQVGNSGTTYLPHLHMTLYYWNENLSRFIGVPSFFDKIKVRESRSFTTSENYSPTTGQSIKSESSPISCKEDL